MSRFLTATGVKELDIVILNLRTTMGSIQLGKMSNSAFVPLRTTLIFAVVVGFLIWSLLTLDMPTSPSQISRESAQEVIIEAQDNAAKVDIRPDYESSTPDEGTTTVTVPSTTGQEDEAVEEIASSKGATILNQTLILYVYADSQDDTALENLKFFIAHGLHAAADFVFIFNGETHATELVPQKDNIRVVQRPNECYDLGAYAEVLLKDDLYKKYKRFITLNASVRGPFIPYWSEGCWSDLFLNRVTDEVKLVGITANCWPSFHIQSMIWATDLIGIQTLLFPPRNALDYLSTHPVRLPPASENTIIDTSPPLSSDPSFPPPSPPSSTQNLQRPGINGCFHDWNSAVAAEVSSTSLILAAGYKVDAMMSAYHGNAQYEEAQTCDDNRDLLFNDGYFGINVHPFETVFIKANRDVAPLVLERYTQWAAQRRYSSYDYCRA